MCSVTTALTQYLTVFRRHALATARPHLLTRISPSAHWPREKARARAHAHAYAPHIGIARTRLRCRCGPLHGGVPAARPDCAAQQGVVRGRALWPALLIGERACVCPARMGVTSCAELLSCGAHTHHDTWSHALELNVVVAQQTAHLAFLALVAGRKQDAAPTRHAWRASRGPEAPDAAVPSAQLGVGKRAQS